LNPEPHNS